MSSLESLARCVAHALNMDMDDRDRFTDVFCESVNAFVEGESDKYQDTVIDVVCYALSLSDDDFAKEVKGRLFARLMTGERSRWTRSI